MKTKTIENTIIEKTTIYVSADGREWNDKEDCLQWEKGIKCVTKASWNNIPKEKIVSTEYGIPYSSEDKECYMLIPRNHDDIVVIHNYMECFCGEYHTAIDDSYIDVAIVMDFGYDGDYCDVYKIEEYLEHLRQNTSDIIKKLKEEK